MTKPLRGEAAILAYMQKNSITVHEPAHYYLKLQGRLAVDWSDWLENPLVGFDGEGQTAVTTVMGRVQDQAGLFGLLHFIRNLGVPLITVRWIPKTDSSSKPPLE